MKLITRKINAALAIATIAFALPTYAVVIPVGKNAADHLLIDYDCSRATATPLTAQ